MERLRFLWEGRWSAFSGSLALDLAILVGLTRLALWIWKRLHRQWPVAMGILAWGLVALILAWLVGRLLPNSSLALRVSIGLVPAAARGWFWLMGRKPLLALVLILLPLLAIGLVVLLAPEIALRGLIGLATALSRQGIPVSW